MAVQDEFDPLGASTMIALFVGEAAVFISHLIWLARFRSVRVEPEATSSGLTPEESVTASSESVTVERSHILTKDFKIAQAQTVGVTVEEAYDFAENVKIAQNPV